jgi:hypothetical protein
LIELQQKEIIKMERSQLNLRISDQLGKLIDAKRIELASTMATIPTRSEVLRFALESYLGKNLSETEIDRRRVKPSKASSK